MSMSRTSSTFHNPLEPGPNDSASARASIATEPESPIAGQWNRYWLVPTADGADVTFAHTLLNLDDPATIAEQITNQAQNPPGFAISSYLLDRLTATDRTALKKKDQETPGSSDAAIAAIVEETIKHEKNQSNKDFMDKTAVKALLTQHCTAWLHGGADTNDPFRQAYEEREARQKLGQASIKAWKDYEPKPKYKDKSEERDSQVVLNDNGTASVGKNVDTRKTGAELVETVLQHSRATRALTLEYSTDSTWDAVTGWFRRQPAGFKCMEGAYAAGIANGVAVKVLINGAEHELRPEALVGAVYNIQPHDQKLLNLKMLLAQQTEIGETGPPSTAALCLTARKILTQRAATTLDKHFAKPKGYISKDRMLGPSTRPEPEADSGILSKAKNTLGAIGKSEPNALWRADEVVGAGICGHRWGPESELTGRAESALNAQRSKQLELFLQQLGPEERAAVIADLDRQTQADTPAQTALDKMKKDSETPRAGACYALSAEGTIIERPDSVPSDPKDNRSKKAIVAHFVTGTVKSALLATPVAAERFGRWALQSTPDKYDPTVIAQHRQARQAEDRLNGGVQNNTDGQTSLERFKADLKSVHLATDPSATSITWVSGERNRATDQHRQAMKHLIQKSMKHYEPDRMMAESAMHDDTPGLSDSFRASDADAGLLDSMSSVASEAEPGQQEAFIEKLLNTIVGPSDAQAEPAPTASPARAESVAGNLESDTMTNPLSVDDPLSDNGPHRP